MKRSFVFTILLVGASAIATQIVFVRELLIGFSGNELSIGFILASWLFGGAIGSALFGALSDRLRSKAAIFAASQIGLAILLPIEIVICRLVRPLLGVNPGELVPVLSVALASLVILVPVTALFGFLFSLACRLHEPAPHLGARKIGEIYILEAIGAIAGGIITSFILIRFLSAVGIVALVSALFAVSAMLSAALCAERRRAAVITVLASAVLSFNILLWFSGGWASIDRALLARAWRPHAVVVSKNSIYSNITITSHPGQYSFFDNGLHLYTIPDKPSAEEAVHFALLEHPGPKKVLLIGGGSGLLAEIEKHPVDRIDYCELDPMIITAAKEYLPPEYRRSLDDKRVFLHFLDGRRYVKQTDEKYDVVIMSLGDPYTAQVNRFYTREFFGEVKRILNEGGILSFGLSSSESFIGRELAEFLYSIYVTLARVYADIKIIPGETAYFLSSSEKNLLTYDYRILMERARSRGVKLEYVREYYLAFRMSEEMIRYSESVIRDGRSVRINNDLEPSSYYYGLISWASRFKDSAFTAFLKIVDPIRVRSGLICISVVIFCAGIISIIRKRSASLAAMLSVAVNGFSQMVFQIIVLVSFQMIYGYMFYKIGIILTAFMAGIALGGWIAVRALPRIDLKQCKRILAALQGSLCVYPFILMAMISYCARSGGAIACWFGANIAYIVLPIVSGSLGGAVFPFANKICLYNEAERGRVAGITYGADLLGSCAGALVTGAIFIPVLGIPETCFALALLNGAVLTIFILREIFL